jgi:light-regulated signal transduction histidine kinase (bacteriophytochrome)
LVAAAQLSHAAGVFLVECLSPFEMTLRGYQEANTKLHALNEDLQRANDAAKAANQELEAFSYSVAHDLRAPLRSIDGFSSALLDEHLEQLDPEGQGYLQRVRAASQRMSELIDDLLSLARISRSELRLSNFDLAPVAKKVWTRLSESHPGRVVDFRVPGSLPVRADQGLLEVVLENLLGNAWKFTGKTPSPRVELGCVEKNGERIYTVRDNGAGFDMAYAGKLFAPFQRLHRSTEFEGTGIGLATVQRVIRRHGGRLWAEGAVGQGATFSFSLPVK